MNSEWDQWDHLAAGSGPWATCLTTALYNLCKHPFPLFFLFKCHHLHVKNASFEEVFEVFRIAFSFFSC